MVMAAFLIVILFFGGWHFWGMTGSADEPSTWADGDPADRGAGGQSDGRDRVLHDGSLELAALPLRSTDVPGLEGDAAAGPGEPGGRGGADRMRMRAQLEGAGPVAWLADRRRLGGGDRRLDRPAAGCRCTTDNRPRLEALQPPEFEPEAACVA